jgi:hypothetical protein
MREIMENGLWPEPKGLALEGPADGRVVQARGRLVFQRFNCLEPDRPLIRLSTSQPEDVGFVAGRSEAAIIQPAMNAVFARSRIGVHGRMVLDKRGAVTRASQRQDRDGSIELLPLPGWAGVAQGALKECRTSEGEAL